MLKPCRCEDEMRNVDDPSDKSSMHMMKYGLMMMRMITWRRAAQPSGAIFFCELSEVYAISNRYSTRAGLSTNILDGISELQFSSYDFVVLVFDG